MFLDAVRNDEADDGVVEIPYAVPVTWGPNVAVVIRFLDSVVGTETVCASIE